MRYYANKSISQNVWYVTAVDKAKAFTVELTGLDDNIPDEVLKAAEMLLNHHLARIDANEQYDLTDDQMPDYGVLPQGDKDAEI